MTFRKVVLAFGLGALAVGNASAGTLERLVQTLEKKNLLTKREARQILSQKGKENATQLLVKILVKKRLLTPEDAKKILATPSVEKTAPSTQKVQKTVYQPQGPGNALGKLSKFELKNLKRLASISIGGVAYLHYDYTLWDTNRSNDGYNEFAVKRAYLEVRKYFNNKDNYFRLTTDVYASSDGSSAVRLKYAYLNWRIHPHMQTEIGLVHRPWLDWEEHHGWLHRDVTNTFIEEKTGAHLITSADYGIALKGKVKGFGYMFGIYNGEGYHSPDDDRHFGKAVAGRVNYSFGSFTVALHALFNDNDNRKNPGEADQFVLHPYAMYRNDLFLVAAQYIYDRETKYYDASGVSHSFTNNGFSINGDLYLKRFVNMPITLFGRYGYWNFDSAYTRLNSGDINAYDRWQVIAGVAYKFNKHVRLSLANEYVKYDSAVKTNANTDRDYRDTVMAVMQVKW